MKRPPLRSRLANIKLFLCDVDGVLTDGSIYIGGEREVKRAYILADNQLALNAGWLASWGLQCGTTKTGTP